jgi:hypothetical protein
MAMVGYGKYAAPEWELGVQEDVVIPRSIRSIPVTFHASGRNTVEAAIDAPADGDLRLVTQQRDKDGSLYRTMVSGTTEGASMGKVLLLRATQNGQQIPVKIEYDRVIWSGLSWAVGEIPHKALHPGQPVTLSFQSTEKEVMNLEGRVYVVQY